MKKNIFFVILLFQFAFTKAQTYHPFPTSNAKWEVYEWGPSQFPTSFKYYLNGDTVLNSTNYIKLMREGVCEHCEMLKSTPCPLPICYIGGIRENIPKKKYIFTIQIH